MLHSFPLVPFSINHPVPAIPLNPEVAVIWRQNGLANEILKRRTFPEPWGGKSYYHLKFKVVFPKYVHGYQLLWAERTNYRLKNLLLVWCIPSIVAQRGSLNVGVRKSDNAKCTFRHVFSAYSGKKEKKKKNMKSPLTCTSEHHHFNGLSSAVIYDGRHLKARDRKPRV